MRKSIEERAASADLTSRDKSILDFILSNRRTACYLTSNEIASEVGVSPSSVVRISGKLGYDNFAAFKRSLQESVAAEEPFGAGTVPHEKIKNYENLPDGEILKLYTQNLIRSLGGDANAENNAKIIEAADITASARRVCIAGFRTCAGFAATAGVMLNCVRPDVILVNGSRPLVDTLIDIDERDAMIAISFARYSSETTFAAEIAKESGCRVIAMTDSYAAPIAKGAACVIISNTNNMGFFDSYAGFIANMEKLLVLVSKRGRESNEARLVKMEKYLKITGQY